jgi:predicted  nucleic acid-binding Zn ribbon protein
MNINLTPEALLLQLGYSKTEHSLQQMERIINNTNNFEKFSSHILSLHDNLAPIKGFVAMSNSCDNLKIKGSQDISEEISKEFQEKVEKWAKKYKVQIKKLADKPTYYILGQ